MIEVDFSQISDFSSCLYINGRTHCRDLYRRTNNISERHNRELRENLNKHPTITEFLDIFHMFHCQYCQYLSQHLLHRSYNSILLTTNLTEHQKDIRSMIRHQAYWTRLDHKVNTTKEDKIQNLWI